MPPVYQRRRAAFGGAVVTALALAAGAEEIRAGPAAPTSPPPPARQPLAPLAAFLASGRLEPVGRLDATSWLGTRFAAGGAEAVRFGATAGATALLPGQARASRALAVLPGGRALVEVAGAPGTWWSIETGGARRALGPPAGERWSLLAAPPGRPALLVAARADADGHETLLELGAGGERRELARIPAGLALAAVSADGRRAALVRSLAPDADELYLLDRVAGETRLLLPDEAAGRFVPQAFAADGRRLLIVADDRADLPRAEWLDLESRSRAPLSAGRGCAALHGRLAPDGTVALELSCSARAELVRIDPGGATLAGLPAPSGTRAVAAWPGGEGEPLVYAVAGARWPRDLWRLDPDGEARPLVYGLSARLEPERLVVPERLELALGAESVGAELWRPRRPAAAGPLPALVWLEGDDRAPPRWFEFEPLFQFWAQRGVAVLRLRGRGGEGLGRAARARAEGRRAELATEDLGHARRALIERAGADPRRIAVVGSGPLAGAVVAAAAARRELGFVAHAALDPAFPAATAAGVEPEPAPEPAPPLCVAPPAAPLLVVFAPATAAEGTPLAACAELVAGGAPLELLPAPPPPFGAPRLSPAVAAALVDHLARALGTRP